MSQINTMAFRSQEYVINTAKAVHQRSNETRPERFPKIFDSAREMYPEAKRILSFGCSEGEECKSLANRFPDAEIVGVDISDYIVQQAIKKNTNPKITFSNNLENQGKFDLVLCLMVLFSLETPLLFDSFEKTIAKVDEHINPGGIFILYTTQYDFCRTRTSFNYDVIKKWSHEHNKDKKTYFDGYYRKKAALEINESDAINKDKSLGTFTPWKKDYLDTISRMLGNYVCTTPQEREIIKHIHLEKTRRERSSHLLVEYANLAKMAPREMCFAIDIETHESMIQEWKSYPEERKPNVVFDNGLITQIEGINVYIK